MQQQHTTRTLRASTIPPSPEVAAHELRGTVRGVDADLVAEITDARRRLDRISPEVIALLGEVRALERRVFHVADVIDGRPDDATSETCDRVVEATGTNELMAAAECLVRAYHMA